MNTRKQLKQFVLNLPKEVIDRLEKASLKTGLTRTAIIKICISDYFEQHKQVN